MLSEEKTLNMKILVILIVVIVSAVVVAEENKIIRSCGEQCINLIFHFYGIQSTGDDIYLDLKPDENGVSSLKDISNCFKKHGLDCSGFKGNPDELYAIKSPVVLFVKKELNDKIGHFAVSFFDAKKKKLMGYDPSMSNFPFELTRPILEKYWTGIGLIVFRQEVKTGFDFNILLMLTIISFLGVLSAIGMNKLLLNKKKD